MSSAVAIGLLLARCLIESAVGRTLYRQQLVQPLYFRNWRVTPPSHRVGIGGVTITELSCPQSDPGDRTGPFGPVISPALDASAADAPDGVESSSAEAAAIAPLGINGPDAHSDQDSKQPSVEVSQSPERAPVDESTSEVLIRLDRVAAEIGGFHARAEAQEELIAKMHARIEVLQSGETKKLLKPVSTQLVALYSDLEDAAASIGPEATVQQFTGLLANFSLTVEQILDNLGLSSLETAPGDDFEPRLHQAIKKIDTTEEASDRKIAAVLRQGFAEPGEVKPTVHSRVSVYRFTGKSAEGTSSPSTGESGAQQL